MFSLTFLLIVLTLGGVQMMYMYSCKVYDEDYGRKIRDDQGKTDSWALINTRCPTLFEEKSDWMKGTQVWPNCSRIKTSSPICKMGAKKANRAFDHCAIFMGDCDDKSFKVTSQEDGKVVSTRYYTDGHFKRAAKDYYTIMGRRN